MSNTAPSIRTLATTAATTLAAFPVIVVGLNLVQAPDGYNARAQAISELALGSGGWLMVVAFCAGGVGTLLMALVFRRTTGATVRPLLLTVATLGSLGSAVFHTDAAGAPTTAHGQVHIAVGIAVFVSELLTMAICVVRFGHEEFWRPMLPITSLLTLTGVAGFFCVPMLGEANFGIAQRILVGSLICWLITAAVWARRTAEARAEHVEARSAVAG